MLLRWTSYALAAALWSPAVASAATTITLQFHGPQGEPVRLTRAEILLSGWGWVDEKEVPPSAPWRSDAFRWPSGDVFDAIHIVLDDTGRELVVRANANVTIDIGLRKPIQRKITLLDEAGAPVAGVPVDVSMFWSNWSHCG